MTLSGIIFDMDGTLVDSALDFDAIRRDIGLSDRQPILEGIEAIPEGAERDRATRILHRHEREGAERAVPYDGVSTLISRLADRNIRVGVLTRNSRLSTDATFSRLGWTFDVVLTREDAPAKPDPSGVLDICQLWQLPPGEILFVGDYLFDLQAGHNAGTRAVLFAPGDLPPWSEQADWIVRDYRQLAELVDQLHTGTP
tara:strand:+ start:118 stop:714 length:597 start_codon:yes stop_codon:yes gene_type:complete